MPKDTHIHLYQPENISTLTVKSPLDKRTGYFGSSIITNAVSISSHNTLATIGPLFLAYGVGTSPLFTSADGINWNTPNNMPFNEIKCDFSEYNKQCLHEKCTFYKLN